jgi:general secretion pathway protein I
MTRGFTLIEALIAFAILAVTLVALYGAMGTSVKGMAQSSRLDEAVLVAESRLAELGELKTLPGPIAGAVEGTGYRWRVEPVADGEAEPPELAASPLRLQQVKLIVSWSEAGRTKEISIERSLLLTRQLGR